MMSKKFTSLLVLCFGLCSSCTQSKKTEPAEAMEKREAVTISLPSASVIYRSTDVGKTWTPYANDIPQDATVSSFLVVDLTTYATTDRHGIYVIKEGEAKWLRLDNDLPEHVDINAIARINNLLVIGTFEHGILISQDDGRAWQQSTTVMNHAPIRCLIAYENMVFAGVDNGIYKSVDQGNTWQRVFNGVQTNGFTVLHNKIYAAVMNGALMSDDKGANWKYIYKPLALHDISNDGESVYAMTLGSGLLKSNDDGLHWENVNDGLGIPKWYTFEVKQADRKLFAAQWHGIYSAHQHGGKWEIIKNGLPDSTAFSTLEVTATGLIAGIGLRK